MVDELIFELDNAREVMYEELTEIVDEENVNEDLGEAISARLTQLYDNKDHITQGE